MAGADSATPTGVPNRDGGHLDESQDRELTPREEALKAIAAKRMGVLAAEIVEGGGPAPQFGADDALDAAAEDEDADARRRAKPSARAAAAAADASASSAAALANIDDQIDRQIGDSMRFTGDLAKTLITVKVDGEEMELPLDRVVANYQKTSTADRRLEEASRLRKEAQALVESGVAAAATPTPEPRAAGSERVNTTDAVFTPLFEGDTAQAGTELVALIHEEAIKILEGRANATPLDVEQVTASVTQQIEWKSKVAASEARYPMMYEDPDVHGVALSKIQKRMDEGMTREQALDEVEASMASSFGWKPASGRAQPKPTPSVLNDRLDRKRQTTPTPAASARRNESQDESEPLMDARDRAARGIAFLQKSRPGQVDA